MHTQDWCQLYEWRQIFKLLCQLWCHIWSMFDLKCFHAELYYICVDVDATKMHVSHGLCINIHQYIDAQSYLLHTLSLPLSLPLIHTHTNTHTHTHKIDIIIITYFFKTFFTFYNCCPNGISPMGDSGCFPQGKPAATESCYLTYCAC